MGKQTMPISTEPQAKEDGEKSFQDMYIKEMKHTLEKKIEQGDPTMMRIIKNYLSDEKNSQR